VALKRFDPASVASEHKLRRKVLYVEDDDSVWEVTEFALQKEFALTRAKNALEAFAALRREEYEIILMDIELSGSDFDGIQITQLLKGKDIKKILEAKQMRVPPTYTRGVTNGDAPIFFVTAYANRYDRATLIGAGGDDVVFKPVDYTRLALVMSRALVRGIH
jgi:CheY-like chemotaxis protein